MKLLFIHIPKIARALSGNSLLRFMSLTLSLWYFALSRKLLKRKGDFIIQGSYNHAQLTFYLRYVMDIAVLREVFVDKEYDWCPTEDPKVIIDLGAHFGDTALYYHARFPNAKIIAVEPSPENYERLIQHTKHIPNIVAVQAAVGSSDGEVTLNLMPSSLGHSVMQRKDSDHSVVVSQLSLATLFQQQKIDKADLIKFDIEGAEFDLISSIPAEEYSTVYIGEIHFDLRPNYNLDWIEKKFVVFDRQITSLSNKKRVILKAQLVNIL